MYFDIWISYVCSWLVFPDCVLVTFCYSFYFLFRSFCFFSLDQGLDLIKEDFADNPIEQYEKHEKKVFSMLQYSREKLMKDVSKQKKDAVRNDTKDDDDDNNGNNSQHSVVKKEVIEKKREENNSFCPKMEYQRPLDNPLPKPASLKRKADLVSDDQGADIKSPAVILKNDLNWQNERKQKKGVNFFDSKDFSSTVSFDDGKKSCELSRKEDLQNRSSVPISNSSGASMVTVTEAKENFTTSINSQSAPLKMRSTSVSFPSFTKSSSGDMGSLSCEVTSSRSTASADSSVSVTLSASNSSIVPSSQIERLLNQDMTQSFYMIDSVAPPADVSSSSSQSASASLLTIDSFPSLADRSQPTVSRGGGTKTVVTSALTDRAKNRFQKSSAFLEKLNLGEDDEWG
jgi:hypothetical protein